MRWLYTLIALGFLGVSVSHVWANRIETMVLDQSAIVFLNKYSGMYCIFVTVPDRRDEFQKPEFCQTEDSVGLVRIP